ncbi:GntR family transcriptional regulator [Kitasatospora sp. NPDC089797]|uniref:GntR family transcriptional regulator n=1 Tax=Kitasatospora sp. NPDC089797 TaxID=3155298 RepID=UPI00341BA82C
MSPRIERPVPAFMQVTDHFRRQIQDGTLPEGAQLPTVAAIEREWGVARATAAKAISQLQVEGLIYSSPRGSFVAGQGAKATSPRDRLDRYRRTGTLDGVNEHHRVTAVGVVTAPTYVSELFDIEYGSPVIRREFVTLEDKSIRSLTVTWHNGALADQVPDLLAHESSKVGTRLARVETVAGRISHGRDFMHARGADAREAAALGIPVGAATEALTWLWNAEVDGETRLVEYGESCLPARHTLSYDYVSAGEGAEVSQ